uniref:MYND-type domain-containing protein n=1 Tax=Lepeophtheirus salmonis TaxID=72036 RepID=A0A0K2TGV0_LEPSM
MTLCETNINENKSSTTTNPSSSSSLKWISQPFFHNSDQGKDTKNCFLCTAPHSEFKCSWCQSIYYCSKEHYSHHRVNSKCFPFQRVQKGLETTRNVRKGELLFKETSILSSPDLHSLPTCPVCLKRILSEKRSTSCAQGCPLRLCNGPCARMTREHGPECKILKDNKVKLDFKDYQTPMSINSVITVLRLMESKKKRPSDWKEFLDPNSIHMEERKKAKGEWEFLQKEVVNYIRNRLFMASDVGDEELHLLIGKESQY